MNHLATADYLVFLIYFVVVVGYGYWIYRGADHRRKRSAQMSTTDFFLAEGSLTWWAIGASLIASNISAEHFIGMAGSGFAMGLAISSYEWFAAATLLIVAVFFIPIYLRNNIYTMPQFLAQRYSDTVSTILAIFWLVVYVLVNLTSILYLGAIAIESLVGVPFTVCTIGLAIFAIFITLGGMKVIGYTDVIQVVVLIFGGLVVTYLSLQLVAQQTGSGNVWDGLLSLRKQADGHFHMYFPKGHPQYDVLPGMALVTGGMWLNNLYYWGCNQYIVQRALGADLKTARSGILFAAFLKLFIPLIVVIPGIAAYVLYQNGSFQAAMTDASGVVKPDQAYPTLMNLLPVGMKGLAFAALTAAIVASLAGKCNSISTIFTLDLYRKYVDKDASEQKLVNVGRWAVVGSFGIAIIIAPMLRSLDQVYQYIQEYTNFVTPGIFSIFLLGFFWKRATNRAAITVALVTLPLSTLLKFWPEVMSLFNVDVDPIPFLHRTTWVFCIDMILMIVISLTDPAGYANNKQIIVDKQMFRVSPSFIVGSVGIISILIALYSMFW